MRFSRFEPLVLNGMDQKRPDNIDELQKQFDILESKREALGHDFVDQMQAIIKNQLQLLRNTGSGAQFQKDVKAAGDVAGRDIIHNNFSTGKYQGEPPKPRNKPCASTGNSSPTVTAISR